MSRIEVEYKSGEGRMTTEAVDYMWAEVPYDGDVIELYAEMAPVDDDETGTYDALMAEILAQAADYGIDADSLAFFYDGEIHYTVCTHDDPDIGHTPSERTAIRIAEAYMQETGQGVYVSWYRRRDGQHAYMNQDGSHSITGQMWEPPTAKPCRVEATKAIVHSGNSLAVSITAEAKMMGLGPGDAVKITLERV